MGEGEVDVRLYRGQSGVVVGRIFYKDYGDLEHIFGDFFEFWQKKVYIKNQFAKNFQILNPKPPNFDFPNFSLFQKFAKNSFFPKFLYKSPNFPQISLPKSQNSSQHNFVGP